MYDIETLDLHFLGFEQLISCFLLEDDDGGFVLLETGPASCLEALERAVSAAGWSMDRLSGVFVTHVHLDHAGAAGALSRRTGCPVHVHPAGLEHLVEPEGKLLPSAARLYGDRMEQLWGRTEGVPERSAVAVADNEVIRVGSIEVRALHTPGHASHHVAWAVGGAVACGDVGGVRFPGSSYVLPPTPPPDIDVEEWQRSIDRLRALDPAALLLTHFGVWTDVERHLAELEERLLRWWETAGRVRREEGGSDELTKALETLEERVMEREGVPPGAAERYRRLCPMYGNAAGLDHAWRRVKRET